MPGRTLLIMIAVPAMLAIPTAAPSFATGPSVQPPAAGKSIQQGLPNLTSVASESLAVRIAEQYRHSVQVSSETTQTDDVIANADGTFTRTTHLEAVRVRKGTGWTAIDLTLQPVSAGWVQPAAATSAVQFSTGGSRALVRQQGANGHWQILNWKATLPTGTVTGDSVNYPNVYPGIDLRLLATSNGYQQVLVVRNPTATGKLAKLGLSAASWWDSAGTRPSAAGPALEAERRPLASLLKTVAAPSAGTVGHAAAAGSNTRVRAVSYPAYVAMAAPPKGESRSQWTYVDSAYPTVNYLNGANSPDAPSPLAHSGYVDAAWADDGRNHVTRAYFQMYFTGLGGKHILHAEFKANLVYSTTCTKTNVVLRTSHTNISSSTTWSNQPPESVVQDTLAGAWRSSCQNGGSTGMPMGFNATQITAFAAQNNSPQLTLMLVAQNETDHASWKKFSNNPTLSATYNSIPGTAAGRAVKPCFLQCGSPVSTASLTPTLNAVTSDADGGNLTYYYEVYAGYAANPTTLVASGNTYAPQGNMSYWIVPKGKLANGKQYEYRVRAYDGTDYGAWSPGWEQFTVDTSGPPPPTMNTADAQTDPNGAPIGTVGAPVRIGFGGSAAVRIAYALGATNLVLSSPPACNSRVQGFTVICSSGGVWPQVTLAGTDETSVVSAVGWDAAGNESQTGSLYFKQNPDFAAMGAGHSWPVPDPATPLGTLGDSLPTNPTPLIEDSGVARGQDSPNPNILGVGDDGSPTPVIVGDEVFNGTGASHTSAAVLDTAKSFTIGAWVNPHSPGTARWAAVAQEGNTTSVVSLQVAGGHFAFCATATDAASAIPDCATSASTAASDTWVYLVGEWDAINHQLRLLVNNGDPAVTAHSSNAAAPGAFWVGRIRQSSGFTYWNGAVYNPFAVQGIVSADALTDLMNYVSPYCDSGTDDPSCGNATS